MFLVLGCGSIGKRHIRNLLALGISEVVALDPRPDRRAEIASEFGISTSDADVDLFKEATAVFICTPPSLHVQQALESVEHGCSVFIEKPLATTLDGLEGLAASVRKKGLVGFVACNYRFHPALVAAREIISKGEIGRPVAIRADYGRYLPDWHPWEDYRNTYSAQAHLGGGVIFDRIHEFDYVRWLMGPISRVFCVGGHVSTLEIDTEDVAEIALEFDGGAFGSVHLDYLRTDPVNTCAILGDQGEVRIDLLAGTLQMIDSERRVQSSGWDNLDVNEMYVDELKHFLKCLAGEETPAQDIAAGTEVVLVALAAKTSAATGQAIEVSGPLRK